MLNKVILIGRVGQDPELKHTKTGVSVCNLSVATTEKFTSNGQKTERTEWHRITVWDKLADLVAEYVRKGKQVYIEGKIQTDKYTAKDGTERTQSNIVASHVLFLSPKSENQTPSDESFEQFA